MKVLQDDSASQLQQQFCAGNTGLDRGTQLGYGDSAGFGNELLQLSRLITIFFGFLVTLVIMRWVEELVAAYGASAVVLNDLVQTI